MQADVEVYVEAAPRRAFACALDWPGWCRPGRTPDAALEALTAYRERYAVVATAAGHPLPRGAVRYQLVEQVQGSANTEFGVPSEVVSADARPLPAPAAAREAALVAAAWTVLDRVVAGAPQVLRKGPRGGGRDRDAIAAHVVEAETRYYARKLGLKLGPTDPADSDAVAAAREAILAVLRRPSAGAPPVAGGWPPRYAARRIAWHAVDHAWEIEDRSES